eukprot:485803-Prorocentrum_minimum.AAC.1
MGIGLSSSTLRPATRCVRCLDSLLWTGSCTANRTNVETASAPRERAPRADNFRRAAEKKTKKEKEKTKKEKEKTEAGASFANGVDPFARGVPLQPLVGVCS